MALPAPFLVPGSSSYPPDHDHEDDLLDQAPSLPIFQLLPETDIGQIYRGDTVFLPIWRALNFYDAEAMGSTLDLTGAFVWATFKIDLAEADGHPSAIQRSTANGGVVIEEPTSGAFRVWLDPVSTVALDDDTMYVFDVQVSTAGPPVITVTVKRGIMKVVRDVTRATG